MRGRRNQTVDERWANSSGYRVERRRRIILRTLDERGPTHTVDLVREVLDDPLDLSAKQNMRRLCKAMVGGKLISNGGGADMWKLREGLKLCPCCRGALLVAVEDSE